MGTFVSIFLPLASLIATTSSAPAVVISDDLSGGPLEISSIIDAKTLSLSRNIRLMVSGTDIKDLQLLSSDLKPDHPTAGLPLIDRSNISIPAGTSLSDGIPRDVRVTIQNVTRPGDYSATLTFVALPAADKTGPPDHPVTIKLHAIAKPDLRGEVGASNAFYVYRVHWPKTTWLFSEWLMPAQLLDETRTVVVDNQTAAAVKVIRADVTLYGDRRGAGMEKHVTVQLPPDKLLKERSLVPLALTVDRDKIPADHYRGSVRLYLENADDAVVIPFTLDVRNGPKAALLMLLVGIVVGRVVRNTPAPASAPPVTAETAGPVATQTPVPSAAARTAAKVFAAVSGSSKAVVEQGRWVQAASFALLLLLLVLVGFQSLYLSSGATFGAGGLYDYLGLFLWGLSADVAQRTLQNFPLH